MNKILLSVIAGFVGVIVLFGLVIFTSYAGGHNKGNEFETRIEAQYKSNQNQLSSMSNQVVEMMQVSDVAKDQVVQVIKAGIEGRFGPNGSQAMVQAFNERYPAKLDPGLLARVMRAVEGNRTTFKVHQDKLIDVCGQYKLARGQFWGGIWIKMAGYPLMSDLEKVCQPVVNEYSAETFSSGRDRGIQLKAK